MTTTNEFDREPCERCSGTGYCGPLTVQGGKCFDCGGKGRVLSARGLRQRAAFRAVFTKKARDVQPGDVLTGDGFKRLTVTKIKQGPTIIANGVSKPTLSLGNDKGMGMVVSPDSDVRRLPTADERDAMLAKVQEIE